METSIGCRSFHPYSWCKSPRLDGRRRRGGNGRIFDIQIDRIWDVSEFLRNTPVEHPRKATTPGTAPRRHPFKAVMKSLARVDRQMSEIPAQAQLWRTMATDLNVSSALITDAKIKASLCGLANQYGRMARRADECYAAYVRKLESASVFSQRLHQYAAHLQMIETNQANTTVINNDNEGA
jgi:hypothetical protein